MVTGSRASGDRRSVSAATTPAADSELARFDRRRGGGTTLTRKRFIAPSPVFLRSRFDRREPVEVGREFGTARDVATRRASDRIELACVLQREVRSSSTRCTSTSATSRLSRMSP